ncbi:MAG: GDP-mannose 4,6-dehydratase [Gemmatimonadales bacterium]
MKTLITGGAGFIGSNAAAHYIRKGSAVVILDNLAKVRSRTNLEWLRQIGSFTHIQADIRDGDAVDAAMQEHADADLVLHLAGQVAVTASLVNPRHDFEANALGTFNILEAVRKNAPQATLIYSSTNKVYGGMGDIPVIEMPERYSYDGAVSGIAETRGLDFHSPYGCSKGAADQYVRDYHRIFGLKTVVFRQSCIYGPRQFGVEDQGWVAWFTIAAQLGRQITIYGDGKQVRDILFVDDLLEAFDSAHDRIDRVAGRVYNMGGGPENTISLCELVTNLEARLGRRIDVQSSDWRAGDQRIYVSDTRRAVADLAWQPTVSANAGIQRLFDWVAEHAGEFH